MKLLAKEETGYGDRDLPVPRACSTCSYLLQKLGKAESTQEEVSGPWSHGGAETKYVLKGSYPEVVDRTPGDRAWELRWGKVIKGTG